MTAFHIDSNNALHGYMRTTHSVFAAVEAPSPAVATIPESIDTAGEVTGNYLEAKFANHGFVRAVDGRHTTFGALGAGTGAGQGTVPITGNPAGAPRELNSCSKPSSVDFRV